MFNYFFNIAIAFDFLINAIIGGYAGETISARAWREKRTYLIKFLDSVFFWDKDHCEETFKWQLDRMDLPEEYRHCH